MKIKTSYMLVSSAITLVTLAGTPGTSFAQGDGVSVTKLF